MAILRRLQFQCALCKLFNFVFYNIIVLEFRIILSPPITGIVNNDVCEELKTRNNYLQLLIKYKLLSIEILFRSIVVTFQ